MPTFLLKPIPAEWLVAAIYWLKLHPALNYSLFLQNFFQIFVFLYQMAIEYMAVTVYRGIDWQAQILGLLSGCHYAWRYLVGTI